MSCAARSACIALQQPKICVSQHRLSKPASSPFVWLWLRPWHPHTALLPLMCWFCVQVNKQFSTFTKRVVQEIWERDFGCACRPACPHSASRTQVADLRACLHSQQHTRK